MSTASPSEPSEVETVQQFDARLRASLAQLTIAEVTPPDDTSRPYPPEALLWTAVAPCWTEPLAIQCGFPGTRPGSTETPLAAMRDAGLLRVFKADMPSPDAPPLEYFAMAPGSRAQTLRPYVPELQDMPNAPSASGLLNVRRPIASGLRSSAGSPQGNRAQELLRVAATIAERLHLRSAEEAMPPELQRWSDLAVSATDPDNTARTLRTRIAEHRKRGNAAGIRDWIETARPLAALQEYAGDTRLSLAIGDGGRAVELLKRREIDFRHLASFHRREEQIGAIERLLSGPDERWALHLLGSGGAGKTMLIRYVSCLLAHAEHSPCADDPNPFLEEVLVARIDFDYLPVDYPRLNPGVMLNQFAEELRAAGDSRANRLFDEAAVQFDNLNKELIAAGYQLQGRASAHPMLVEGVRSFCDALRQLGKRVLLILDTCEELARADSAAEPNGVLEETFRILRALHDGPDSLMREGRNTRGGVPNLRVLFSGRRLLAQGDEKTWRAVDSHLPARPFLDLHVVRGFTKEEARPYLRHEGVPEDLLTCVLDSSSPDPGIGARFDPPLDVGPDKDRCNPYLLRLYMDWALEDPAPEPTAMRSGGGLANYVELRIIQRIRDDELLVVLPLLAMLGHIDMPTLRQVGDLHPAQAERLFRSLQDFEWISTRRSGARQEREVLDVLPSMRDAMSVYFSARNEPTSDIRARAITVLEELTLGWDVGILEWSDIDAGLRAMDHDPQRGAEWWTKVADVLLRERNFDWAVIQPVLDRLLGPEGAARLREPDAPPGTPRQNRLRPFVLALQAEAWLHTGSTERLESVWREVVDATETGWVSPLWGRLHRRALAGQVAAARYSATVPVAKLVDHMWGVWTNPDDPRDAASLVAALETLLDIAEVRVDTDPAEARALLAHWQAPPEQTNAAIDGWITGEPEQAARYRELQAVVFSVAGRAARVSGDSSLAMQYLWASVAPRELPDSAAYWPDWVPPVDTFARLKVEFARAAYPGLITPETALEALRDRLRPYGSGAQADADRVYSTILQLRLAQGNLQLAELGEVGWLDANGQGVVQREGFTQPSELINAHRYVSPLFVSVSQVFAACGLPELAIGQLRAVTENRQQFDTETVWHAERALLHLVRRLRLNDQPLGFETSLASSLRLDDLVLLWALEGMEGPRLVGTRLPPPIKFDWRILHALWQKTVVLDEADADKALKSVEFYKAADFPFDANDYSGVARLLDAQEAGHLSVQYDVKGWQLASVWTVARAQEWAAAHADQPVESLRVLLRTMALLGQNILLNAPAEAISRVGARRAAEIAFEEAELLGLRLPTNAHPLANWAGYQFTASGDPYAAFFAHTLSAMLGDATDLVYIAEALHACDKMRQQLESIGSDPLPPTIDELQALAAAPTPAGLSALGPPLLQPWLVRLVACVMRQGRSQQGFAVLSEWLVQNYGARVDDAVRLPTEWARFVSTYPPPPPPPPSRAEATAPSPAPAPSPSPATPARSAAALTWRPFVAWFSGIAASIALSVAVVSLLGDNYPRLVLAIVAATASVAVLSWSVSVARRTLALQLRAMTLRLDDALPALPSGVTERTVRVDELFSRVRFPSLEPTSDSKEYPASTPLTTLEPYVELASALPGELVYRISRLIGRRFPRPLRVVVQVKTANDLHGVCWEGMLQLAVAKQLGRPPAQVPVQCWRVPTSSRRPPPPPERIASPHGESVAGTETANVVLRNGLGASRRNGLSWTFSRGVGDGSQVPEVVHLIGAVQQDPTGPVLALEPQRTYGTQIARASSPSPSATGPSTPPEPPMRLIRPSELIRLYPRMRVCVIQAHPEEELGARLDTDRQTAALMRLFAAEVARDGVAVVVLPRVGLTVATRLWARLIDALPDFMAKGVDTLLPVVPELRALITADGHDAASAIESGLDVCIYDARPPQDSLVPIA